MTTEEEMTSHAMELSVDEAVPEGADQRLADPWQAEGGLGGDPWSGRDNAGSDSQDQAWSDEW